MPMYVYIYTSSKVVPVLHCAVVMGEQGSVVVMDEQGSVGTRLWGCEDVRHPAWLCRPYLLSRCDTQHINATMYELQRTVEPEYISSALPYMPLYISLRRRFPVRTWCDAEP